MSRPKILNPKNETILLRLDRWLFIELYNYAKRNDKGIVSVSARKALEKFLLENTPSKEV